jgi:hypothetical protein
MKDYFHVTNVGRHLVVELIQSYLKGYFNMVEDKDAKEKEGPRQHMGIFHVNSF